VIRKRNEHMSLILPTFLALGLFSHSADAFMSSSADSPPWVIYGDDNRQEVYESGNPAYQILAESVVAIMESKDISTDRSTGNFKIKANTYGENNLLCMTERFVEQPDAAFCSGFLVSDNVIATAGHCVEDKSFCKESKFVFDYMYDAKKRNPLLAKQDAVYGCKRVIAEKADFHGSDYALVELDRPVVGRTPLKIAGHKPGLNDSLFIIGNPVGLPTKVADGAIVLSHGPGFFVADLDAFSGNSGAAVFNDQYEVAGILVRGEDDFIKKGGCYVANSCQSGTCRGEDVTNPDVLANALSQHLLEPSKH
jgi:hypothetical protein